MKKPKFKFRLERVKKFKQTLKTESERTLVQETQALNQREKHLEEIISKQDGVVSEEEIETTMAELEIAGSYKEALQLALIRQRELIFEAKDAVDKAREVFLDRSRDHEVFEKLKEKKREEFQEDLKSRERKFINNITTGQVSRRLSNKENQEDE